MRFKWFAQAAACALLVTSVQYSADAKPKRPAASAAAKKKAAAAAAAKKEADRLAAEAAAKAAAEAAEKARIRAQWGVLADIGEGDFQTADGMPVTVRKSDNAVEVTLWGGLARAATRFERDPATGAMTLSSAGQWSRKTAPARVLADGTIEATAKNESRWTVIAPDPKGGFAFASGPGGKISFTRMEPIGKAAAKLASLVATGKVEALGGAPAASSLKTSSGVAMPALASVSIPAAGPLTAQEAFDRVKALKGYWTNGEMLYLFWVKSDRVDVDTYLTQQAWNKDWSWTVSGDRLLVGDTQATLIPGGIIPSGASWALMFRNDDSFDIVPGKLKHGIFVPSKPKASIANDGHYVRKDFEFVKSWVSNVNAAETRRQQQAQSGGNSGWLGGLIMGGVAAAAGGDAGMVMGAAMKGVEMTTDNEMTRNVLAGQGDAMIQSSIDTKNQIAETERLRVAAAEETRRKREAEAKAEADSRSAKARSDQQARDAEARDLAASAEQQKRDAAAAAEADKRRRAEEQRLAELKRKQEEAARPIDFKEGVVLCEKKRENYYRCDGPLQVTYSDLTSASGLASIGQACGSDRWRDMGMAGSYRAFGCNFGMNPDGMAPGNRDVPAAYGLFVERAIFHCPRSKDAYCMTR